MNMPQTATPSLASQLKLDAHWMPFSANRNFKRDPRIIVGADGNYFIDDKGRRVFDSLSGLWTCGAGHNRKEIQEAVAKQLGTLDYAPGFQYGHPLSYLLAEKITELTPAGLDHVFYTDSGSECADTSVKMARAYWRLKGQPSKTKFIGRARGYHGVNIAGTSLGGIGGNRKMFGQMMDADHLPHTLQPHLAYTRGMAETGGVELANELLKLIELHDASNIAAVIVEPMSGSAGVIVPPQGYLQRLREICTQHNILLIFDEVITAYGRMGKWTGAEYFGVTPDIMNTAKQVTNGAIPLGPGCDWAATRARLIELPGIGPWSTELIAMRGLGDPDAFPASDLGVRTGARILGLPSGAAVLATRAQSWRPWRSYATQYLWGAAASHPINQWPPKEAA